MKTLCRNINNVKVLINFVLCLILCSSATAAVYYVDPSTGNDANNGTATGTPWAHVPNSLLSAGSGWHQLVNGDTLVVKGGSVNQYSVVVTNGWFNGSAAYDSIVIISGDIYGTPWGTGHAVFDEQNTRNFGFAFYASGNNISGVSLRGLEIKNIATGPTTGIGGEVGSCIAIGSGGVNSFIWIDQCYLHDSGTAGSVANNANYCVEIDGGQDHDIIVSRCRIYNCSHKGIEFAGETSCVASNNFIYNTGDHHIALNRTSFSDVCNNLLDATASSWTALDPNMCIVCPSTKNCDIWNNLIMKIGTPASGVGGINDYVAQKAGSTPAYTNKIVFNTFGLLNSSPDSHYDLALRLGDYDTKDDLTTIYHHPLAANNIFYKNQTGQGNIQFMWLTAKTDDGHVNYNDMWGGASTTENVCNNYFSDTEHQTSVANFSTSQDFTHNQQVDPKLVGGTLPSDLDSNWHPNTTYFSISSTSPSSVTNTGNVISGDVNSGYVHSAGKFKVDIMGNDRTGGGAGNYYAMGAYALATSVTDPSITTQPQSQTVNCGSTATFTVTATGTPTLTYQWSKNGSTIAGATLSAYTTAALTAANNSDQYKVAVTSGVGGPLTSSTATLTVNLISVQPTSQTVNVGQNATFTTTGLCSATHQWYRNGVLIGGATSASYTENNCQLGQNGNTYYDAVTSGGLTQNSSIVNLTVNGTSPAQLIVGSMNVGVVINVKTNN